MCEDTRSPVTKNLSDAWRHARRVVTFVVGVSIVVIGLVLLVLPGPASVVIPVGLAILATEFVWARRLLRRAREQGEQIIGAVMGNEQEKDDDSDDKKSLPGAAEQDESRR
jgi:tellurite resistance protein TerC